MTGNKLNSQNVSGDTQSVYAYYVRDLGILVKEKAIEARTHKDDNPEALFIWHEIVSLMQSQAAAFGIPLSQIGLEDIDPERDLL